MHSVISLYIRRTWLTIFLVTVVTAMTATLPCVAQSAPAATAKIPLVTNVFVDTELRQALADIAAQTGVTIIPDSTVQADTVSMEFKGVPVESALTRLLLVGGYAWAKIDDFYLVGEPEPDNPNFALLCASEIYPLQHCTPKTVMAKLGKVYERNLRIEEVKDDSPTKVGAMTSEARSGRSNGPATYAQESGDYRILITAPRFTMDRIKQDIALIDQAPDQVMLEAAVVEVSSEALKNIGLDWATRWISGTTAMDTPNLVYSSIERDKLVSITALLTNGQARLRANPRVAALDGQTAELEVGKEDYFQIVTGPINYPTASLEKIESGIFLRMTPRVLATTGEIEVYVQPEVRDVTGRGKNDLPQITVRRASTVIRVKAGQSIVIGGLMNEQTIKSVSRIPVLGDLPLFGGLFQRTTSQQVKSEVVIVITPKLLTE